VLSGSLSVEFGILSYNEQGFMDVYDFLLAMACMKSFMISCWRWPA